MGAAEPEEENTVGKEALSRLNERGWCVVLVGARDVSMLLSLRDGDRVVLGPLSGSTS